MKNSAIKLYFVATCIFSLCWPALSRADYLGSQVLRIFLDPASAGVVADGYQAGDEVSWILQSSPRDTGSYQGQLSFMTLYVPPGTEVVRASIVRASGTTWTDKPAYNTAPAYDQCGKRDCMNYSSSVTGINLDNGILRDSQSDTGIFYSTDSRTQLTPTALTPPLNPTGISGGFGTYNQWDYDQTVAFGEAGNPSGNNGKGNTPVVSVDGGTTWKGTGSPVAGPDVYYTNDYDPACSTETGFAADITCVGPWQRIAYAGSSLSRALSEPVAPTTIDDGDIEDWSVPTLGGSAASPLPASTNAVRWVFGMRNLGDVESARVMLRITDPVSFVNSFANETFCVDSSGGDTSGKSPTDFGSAKDNVWRYYEPRHQCFETLNGSTGIMLVNNSVPIVNGCEGPVSNIQEDDILGYTITVNNTSTSPVTNIAIQSTEVENLHLLEPGDEAQCPFSSYDGNPSGPTYSANSASTGTASWAAVPTLAAGESFSVSVCGKATDGGVGAGGKTPVNIRNIASVTFESGGISRTLESEVLGQGGIRAIYGQVQNDADNSGIPGVQISLYRDKNSDQRYDPGVDTLEASMDTLADGAYEFQVQENDDYVVVETDPAGSTSISDADNPAGTCGTGNGCNEIAVEINDNVARCQFFRDSTPTPAIDVQKTVYSGHDSGAGCGSAGDLVTAPSGTAVTYCFDVTNTGDTYLDAITLIDSDLVIDQSDMTVLSGTQPLASSDSTVLYYQTTMSADLTNTVTASANPTDLSGNDLPGVSDPTDTDTAEVDVVTPAQITLEKTANPTSIVEPGGDVVFSFTITNTSTGSGVRIDYLTDDVFGNLDSIGTCALPQTLAPLSSYSCAITQSVSGSSGDVHTNVATADGTDLVTSESVTANDSANVNVVANGLTIDKQPAVLTNDADLSGAISPGDTIEWPVIVTNTGAFDLTGVVVTDDKADALTCPVGSQMAATVWSIGDLAASAAASCTATYLVTASDQTAGQIVNLATADSNETPAVDDTETTPVPGPATLAIDKQVAILLTDADSSGNITVGDTIQWPIIVSNTGASPLTNVILSDDQADSVSCPVGSSVSASIWQIGTLNAGQNVNCAAQYTVQPADGTAGQVVNVAQADSTEDGPVDDTVTTPIQPPPPVAINVVKTADPAALNAPGGDVTFDFTVSNPNAENLTVTGLVDSVYGDLDGQGTCSLPQALTAGGQYQCSISVTVTGSPGESHYNTVTATGENDTGTSASAQDSAVVQLAGTEIEGCPHCPVKVTFRRGGLDFLGLQGEVMLPNSFNPTANSMTVSLSNANGTIYSGALMPGDLISKGHKWFFRDKGGKLGYGSRDGIYTVKLKVAKSGLWRVKIKAYSDLSAATLAEMTMELSFGSTNFGFTGTFTKKSKGWQIKSLYLP
ncbi:MAG: hypothetical protein P8R42_10375 [Candidatus Binatia bacterium]|nr:hypothetical protein [Candidatus Binatia bacterium]